MTCKSTILGRQYLGKVSHTSSGIECQRWDSQTPNEHSRSHAAYFPEKYLADAANYCRNPDSESEGPWCYTMSLNTRWEFCDVPLCKC